MSRTFLGTLHRLWIALGGTPFHQGTSPLLQECPTAPAVASDNVVIDRLVVDEICRVGDPDLRRPENLKYRLGHRLHLEVPFREKDDAKKLGARWDSLARKWYVPAWKDTRPFTKWVPLGTPLPGGVPRLTIELVPSTCWYANVRSNVTPATWKALKTATARAARHRCEICGGRGERWPVECHEIWHYDDEQHIQRLAGLIALCPGCHRAKHIGKAEIDGFFDEVLDHICIVNDWTFDVASDYIDECFEQWSRRSKFHWTLDISWLERYDALMLPLPYGQTP